MPQRIEIINGGRQAVPFTSLLVPRGYCFKKSFS